MARLFSVLGDSISTFEGCNPAGFAVYYTHERARTCGLASPRDTWWSQVVAHFGGELLANGSWSGSMVEGAGYPAAWSPERVAALADGGRVPDDIVAFIGINDYGWGGAAAQAAGRSAATPPCTDLAQFPPAEAGRAPRGALEGFSAAYRTMLRALRAAYPAARIWCCTLLPGRLAGSVHPTHAWNLRGVPMEDYNGAIRAAARECGCTLADAARYGLDYEAVDGTHPTRLGMVQIAALVVAAMEGRDAPEAAPFAADASQACPGPVDWRSRVLCADRCCVGCPWAMGAGSSWYCVCTRAQGAGDAPLGV